RWGTLPMRTGSSASSVAARIGNAAFLAPETRISPSSRCPPPTSSLSIGAAGSVAGGQFRRRQRADRQGMDFPAHLLAERAVDELVPLQGAQPLELIRDDQRGEMRVVLRLHLDPGRGHARADQGRNLFTVHLVSG